MDCANVNDVKANCPQHYLVTFNLLGQSNLLTACRKTDNCTLEQNNKGALTETASNITWVRVQFKNHR